MMLILDNGQYKYDWYNNRSKSYSLVKNTSWIFSYKVKELILQKLDKNILFFRYEDFCQH